MAQAAVLRAHNRAYNKGSDPRVATCRGKLQTRRSKLNQEINRELRLRAGAENLLKATSNRKLRETVSLELSFLNSNLQLLKQQLADLNSSVELYQPQSNEPIMPMIPLGLKETKEIDFREPFKDFILEHYSEDGDKYESAITEFMELRQAMRTPDRDASGIALLYQYFNHLYFVERRFFPPDRSLGIYFEWYDSLTGAPSCQRTVALEKACVVFNCGALYTQVGAREAKRDPKALDRAVDAFLRAAGTLQYLIDNFTNAPSLDLSPSVLSLLVNINLAQARECLVEKLELQKQKDRSCDELSKETGALAQAYSETKMAAEGLEEIPASWTGIVALKTEYYRGVQCEREADCSSSSCRSGWLKSSLGHYEEAARLQRMSRDLRGKRSLQECLQRAIQRISSALAQTPQELDEPLELPQPSSGGSKFELRPTPPDFGEQRVDDLFRSLGPLAVFSAKHHWSAPRTVLLRHKMTSQSNSSAASYGLTVSTDCPVVVTSVTPNSLAQCGGIKEGDYIVGIGDKDVKWWSHDEVVRLIKEAQGTLYLRLVTPMDKPSRLVSRTSKKGLTETAGKSRATPEGTGGKPSSTSSLKKLSWNPFRRNKDQREAAALTMILT